MELTIKNNVDLDCWMNECLRFGQDMKSIKGKAPDGATYYDGQAIIGPVNIAWLNVATGDVFNIEYM